MSLWPPRVRLLASSSLPLLLIACEVTIVCGCGGTSMMRHIPEPPLLHGWRCAAAAYVRGYRYCIAIYYAVCELVLYRAHGLFFYLLIGIACCLLTADSLADWSSWEQVGGLGDEAHLNQQPLQFSLQVCEQGQQAIEAIARRVSDPKSSAYGRYLSHSELEALAAPVPEAMDHVLRWLGGMNVTRRGSSMDVWTTVGEAARLLNTSFRLVQHPQRRQPRLRAGDLHVPDYVAAVFGLHGLPVHSHRRSRRSVSTTTHGENPCHPEPYPITPSVLLQQYGMTGVSETRSIQTNRQAFVDTDGQFVNESDTELAFRTWVPKYKPGVDDKITFVGKHPDDCYDPETGAYDGDCDIASNLEVQYGMMVAPGVPTEFWETYWQYPAAAGVCDELYQWSTSLVTTDNIPLVHSISFAWQKNVSELCSEDVLGAIDANLAKLAAKGITVLAASGDNGPGFQMGVPQCDAGGGLPESAQQGVAIEGTVAKVATGTDLRSCCEVVQPDFPPTAGWTWVAPRPAPPPALSRSNPDPTAGLLRRKMQKSPGWPHLIGDYEFKNQSFYDGNGAFGHDIYILNGVVSNVSGQINVHCVNGTIPDTPMLVGEWVKFDADQWFRKVSIKLPKLMIRGQIMFSEAPMDDPPAHVDEIVWGAGAGTVNWGSWEPTVPQPPPSPPLPPPPPMTPSKCTVYSSVTGHRKADGHTFSGVLPSIPLPPMIFAPWPASSPWVTAVGSSSLKGEQPGGEETASVRFGSGSGFSSRYKQEAYQAQLAKDYLSKFPPYSWPRPGPTPWRNPPVLPPRTSFDIHGRVTPDLVLVGEGFMVIEGGVIRPHGVGTATSLAVFTGMVAQINEARISAGKPPMGCLNPWMYAHPEAFHDVTEGTNALGDDDFGGCIAAQEYGFNATESFDAVSGLGTPKFPEMLRAALGQGIHAHE